MSRRAVWSLSLVLTCLAFAACSDRGTGPKLTAEDRGTLQVQGDRLVAAIEAYHKAHGKYPATLAEAGIAPADTATKFGSWTYQHSDGDPSFGVTVGDYVRHDFALWWNTDFPYWYRDT